MLVQKLPNLGVGVGLRPSFFQDLFSSHSAIDFFEIISENYMIDGGLPLYNLGRVLERYPVVIHGVSMSIASADPLDFSYLKRLKQLARLTKTPWFSDHLCWSSINGVYVHDLLPMPYTLENANYIAERARIVQDFMELPFALENLSSYVTFKSSEMPEWEFYKYVVEKADCFMMLDVNNVFVSSVNHDFEPMDYLKNLPYERVIQTHIAGHTVRENGFILDTHNDYVCEDVWELYRFVHQKTGGVSTILEWDSDFLTFAETHSEALKALDYMGR